jgi:hypothetical protein
MPLTQEASISDASFQHDRSVRFRGLRGHREITAATQSEYQLDRNDFQEPRRLGWRPTWYVWGGGASKYQRSHALGMLQRQLLDDAHT